MKRKNKEIAIVLMIFIVIVAFQNCGKSFEALYFDGSLSSSQDPASTSSTPSVPSPIPTSTTVPNQAQRDPAQTPSPPVPTGGIVSSGSLADCPFDKSTVVPGNAAILSKIRSMSENSWLKINQNTFESVLMPISLRPSCSSSSGQNAIINAWGGFAFDSKRSDLLVFGGGHGDYCGNDIYRFRLSTLRWELAGNSSDMRQWQILENLRTAYPIDGLDNAPSVGHMYDVLTYLPMSDRLIYMGGRPSFDGRGLEMALTVEDPRLGPWLFDPSKADGTKVVGTTGSGVDRAMPGGKMWENRNYGKIHPDSFILPYAYDGTEMVGSATVCEGTTNIAILRAPHNGVASLLVKYAIPDIQRPDLDRLTPIGAVANHKAQGDLAVDPGRQVAVVLGDYSNRPFVYWDLSNQGPSNPLHEVNSVNNPDGTYVFSREYGMDFDPIRGRFLIWDGTSQVWELNLPRNVPVGENGWTINRLTNTSGPAAPAWISGGANGKWKYAPGLDIFIGLREAPSGDVWIFKPVGWVDPGSPGVDP